MSSANPTFSMNERRAMARRSNIRFMKTVGIVGLIGATVYYMSNNSDGSQRRKYVNALLPLFMTPSTHLSTGSYRRYSDYPNASYSNQKGINTSLTGNGREVNRVRGVSVERSGGGV
ncbi:hypothetical protein V1511DRAFT_513475 [Dipodascopsis uninucleata]